VKGLIRIITRFISIQPSNPETISYWHHRLQSSLIKALTIEDNVNRKNKHEETRNLYERKDILGDKGEE